MIVEEYGSDVEAILERRYDNGGDYWTTEDGRIRDKPSRLATRRYQEIPQQCGPLEWSVA